MTAVSVLMPRISSLLRLAPPAFLGLSLFVVYLLTLAPGLTWANAGADGGDLIAAAATGGVAHPTGYPTYLLLARLAQYAPLGSLAFRTSLLSAAATALAAVLLYRLILRAVGEEAQAWPAGLAAGFAFGLAPLVWSQAVITEVYAVQSLLILLALTFSTNNGGESSDRLCGLVLGLGTGNHVTMLLLVPIVLLARVIHPSQGRRDWRSFGRRSAFFALGLLIYLSLPLRAGAGAPVNWGNPVSLERLWWLVSGRLYATSLFPMTLAGVGVRLQAWAAVLVEQWGLAGLSLALVGLVFFFAPSPLYVFTLWQALAYSAFSIVYSSFDSYVYLLPVCISVSVWIGLGLGRLVTGGPPAGRRLGWAVSALVILWLWGCAAAAWPQVDASQDMRAEIFGRQVLASAPPGAVLVAEGDEAVFALWYFHFALGERPDLVVAAADLLHFDWYQETLRQTYPSLVVPGPFPWPETLAAANPERPVCRVQATEEAVLTCFEGPGPRE